MKETPCHSNDRLDELLVSDSLHNGPADARAAAVVTTTSLTDDVTNPRWDIEWQSLVHFLAECMGSDEGSGVYNWLLEADLGDQTETLALTLYDALGPMEFRGGVTSPNDGDNDTGGNSERFNVVQGTGGACQYEGTLARTPTRTRIIDDEVDDAPGTSSRAAEPATDEAIRVEYIGTVGLLELRGGGRKEIEDLLMELGPHNTDALDPIRACDGCRRLLNRADEIWALCVNGHFRCEECATSLHCPWCPTTSESDHRTHGRVADGEPFAEFGISVGHVQRAIHRIEHGYSAGSLRRAVPGGGKRGGTHDNGAGILRWLYESDDEADEPPLPEATDSSSALGHDVSPGAGRYVPDSSHQDETPAQAATDRDASETSQSNEGAHHTTEWRVFDHFAPEFVQHGQWLDHHIGNPQPTENGVVIAPWATITGTYDHGNIRICRQCHLGRPASSSHWRPLRGGLVVCDVCFESPTTTTQGPPAPERATVTDSSGSSAWSMEGLPGDQPLVPLLPPPLNPLPTRACGSCGADLSTWGSEWRVCGCSSPICTTCWELRPGCVHCRPPIWQVDATAQELADGRNPAQLDNDLAQPVQGTSSAESITGCDQESRPWSPKLLSPAEADELREGNRQRREEWLQERKLRSRAQARAQAVEGTRPRRPRNFKRITVLTMNTNCSSRLRDEVDIDDCLRDVDIAMVQEHREHGESSDTLARWLRGRAWDPVIEDAYFKTADYGGGTAVIARGPGIRPLEPPPDTFRGRVAWAESDLRGSTTLGSVYAISGQGPSKQVPLWCHIAQRLMATGLPFVLGGGLAGVARRATPQRSVGTIGRGGGMHGASHKHYLRQRTGLLRGL